MKREIRLNILIDVERASGTVVEAKVSALVFPQGDVLGPALDQVTK